MGKWIITVADNDDKDMAALAKTANPVWIKDWAPQFCVQIEDMRKFVERRNPPGWPSSMIPRDVQ